MTDDEIQELVHLFLEMRGGYVAGASERELFLMVKVAVDAAERAAFEQAAQVAEQLGERYNDGTPWLDPYNACLGAAGIIRALATSTEPTRQ